MPVTLYLSPKPKFDPKGGVWIMEDDWLTVNKALLVSMIVHKQRLEAATYTPAERKVMANQWLRACSTRLRLIKAPGTLLLKNVPQKVLENAPEDALVAYLPEIIGQKAANVALMYGVGKKN